MVILNAIQILLDVLLVIIYGYELCTATTTTQIVLSAICLFCWAACTVLNSISFITFIRYWRNKK